MCFIIYTKRAAACCWWVTFHLSWAWEIYSAVVGWWKMYITKQLNINCCIATIFPFKFCQLENMIYAVGWRTLSINMSIMPQFPSPFPHFVYYINEPLSFIFHGLTASAKTMNAWEHTNEKPLTKALITFNGKCSKRVTQLPWCGGKLYKMVYVIFLITHSFWVKYLLNEMRHWKNYLVVVELFYNYQ